MPKMPNAVTPNDILTGSTSGDKGGDGDDSGGGDDSGDGDESGVVVTMGCGVLVTMG